MKNLLTKELKLAMHPTGPLFIALSAMLLIPNYPFYVVFFYTSLALFFICLSGRENRDIFYTMLLPVGKRDIVKSRICTAVILQLAQAAAAVPFIFIRNALPIGSNAAGMEANAALIGLSMIMTGLSNMVFFTSYYKDVNKVGTSFMFSGIVTLIFTVAAEACVHAVPFVKEHLDTVDSENRPLRLAVLAVGFAVYAVMTFITYKISAARFEKIDL